MKRLFLVIILFLLLLSCTTYKNVYLKRDLKKAKLLGKVITEEGLPLEGVRVKLTDFIVTKTDINGRFLFNFLSYGKYSMKFEKNDYLTAEYEFVFSFRNRKNLPFIKVKMFSTNYLVDEGFEYLKEKKYDKTKEIIDKLEKINPIEEVVKYLKAIYFYENAHYNEALPILEDLKENDRSNIYYQLTLADVYEKLKMHEEQAKLTYYIGVTNPKKYYEYLKDAADIYKDALGNQAEYEKIIAEYNKYKNIYEIK